MIGAGDIALARSRRNGLLLVLLVTAVPAVLLYGRHLHDPLVFDSASWFSERNLEALRHLDGSDRYLSKTAAYWLHRLSGGRTEMLRAVSVGLHVLTAVTLFLLLRRLAALVVARARNTVPLSAAGTALAAAALFTLHPVQVYAVAYHGQMEIVMATLFGLVMLLAYLEGVERESTGLVLLGAALYLLAVLSKENLVAMPGVALAMTLLLRRPSRALVGRVWPYFALSAAVAVWIVARELAEPHHVARGVTAAAGASPTFGGEHMHGRSIVTQGHLFFRYLLLWLVPNVGWMSIDLQYPLAPALLSWPETAGFVAFCLYPVAAVWLLLRQGRAGLIGFGLLWPWLLFPPELSTTRLTESFVLYRGYPWIGGVLIALVVTGAAWLGRAGAPLVVVACLGLAGLADERLSTFRSARAVWDDAVAKNRPYEGRAVGVYRAYFNRGTALLREGRPEAALRDFGTALDLRPGLAYASLNAGLAHIRLQQYPEALRDFDEGLANGRDMPPPARAAAYSNRAGLYLLLRRPRDAADDLAQAAALDPGRAEYRENLRRLLAELESR